MSTPSTSTQFWPLVPCAGFGSRSGAPLPKQYVCVAGKAVVAHTLQALHNTPQLQPVTVVLAPSDTLFAQYCPDFSGVLAPVGGQTRAQSVRAGLQALREQGAQDTHWVLVHDAARCLLLPLWVQMLIEQCQTDDVGGLLAQPVPDTLKLAREGRSIATVDRQNKWLAQTPQMFRLQMLETALDQAQTMGLEITDEASAIEAMGLHPKLVPCSADNFKLTYPPDFERAQAIFQARHAHIRTKELLT